VKEHRLSDRDFQRLSEFIYDFVGIKMPPAKKTMVEGRLAKRVRLLGHNNYSEYCDFVFSPEGQRLELVHLIDVITTNKTDFFREPAHFDYLADKALPTLLQNGSHRKMRVWSAGCSSGEEPYTLAMVLTEFHAKHHQPAGGFDILATDISTRVLDMARKAVYTNDRIVPVPMPLRRKYLLKSRDPRSELVRISPELRRMVTFGRLNFMDEEFGIREPMDVIFCRNVIIYFDKKTQEELMRKFCRHLVPGGFLFLGHSESLHGYEVPLVQVAPTVYRKPQA